MREGRIQMNETPIDRGYIKIVRTQQSIHTRRVSITYEKARRISTIGI